MVSRGLQKNRHHHESWRGDISHPPAFVTSPHWRTCSPSLGGDKICSKISAAIPPRATQEMGVTDLKKSEQFLFQFSNSVLPPLRGVKLNFDPSQFQIRGAAPAQAPHKTLF